MLLAIHFCQQCRRASLQDVEGQTPTPCAVCGGPNVLVAHSWRYGTKDRAAFDLVEDAVFNANLTRITAGAMAFDLCINLGEAMRAERRQVPSEWLSSRLWIGAVMARTV